MRSSDGSDLSRERLTRIYQLACRGLGWARTYGLNFPILPTARPKLSYDIAPSPSIDFTSASDSRSAMTATRSPAPMTVLGIGMVSGSFAGPWA